MFKRVLQTLRSFGTGAKTSAAAPAAKSPEPAVKRAPAPAPVPAPKVMEKSRDKPQAAPAPQPVLESALPPEELCGLTPEMSKEAVRAQLAFLYKRYNRATSSLDPTLRAEAEAMLDAIVAMREKHFGPI